MTRFASSRSSSAGRHCPPQRCGAALAQAVGAVLVAWLALGCSAAPPHSAPPLEAEFSFFAFGDQGKRPRLTGLFDGQLSVADALDAADERRPANAIVLLGDNFYPDGLERGHVVDRIRANLVHPYCRFVHLTAPESGQVASACDLAPNKRRPIPIYAVLGNHDHKSADSPQLQIDAIPNYVANWHMSRDLADVVDLGPGLSLVLFDSTRLMGSGNPAPLRNALRRAEGPWRVLVAHHPLDEGAYGKMIRRTIEEARVPVQVFLAGHEHDLQIGTLPPPGPSLEVIAGGGSSKRPPKQPLPGRRFFDVSAGFARIDLVPTAQGKRLFATLVSVPQFRAHFWESPQVVARWSVDLLGDTRHELAER